MRMGRYRTPSWCSQRHGLRLVRPAALPLVGSPSSRIVGRSAPSSRSLVRRRACSFTARFARGSFRLSAPDGRRSPSRWASRWSALAVAARTVEVSLRSTSRSPFTHSEPLPTVAAPAARLACRRSLRSLLAGRFAPRSLIPRPHFVRPRASRSLIRGARLLTVHYVHRSLVWRPPCGRAARRSRRPGQVPSSRCCMRPPMSGSSPSSLIVTPLVMMACSPSSTPMSMSWTRSRAT